MNPELFICYCGNVEHQLIVTKDEDFLYFQVHLAMLPWWKRIYVGVRYIFGYRSSCGDFDDIIFDDCSAHKLGATLLSFRSQSYGATGVEQIKCTEAGTEQSPNVL